MESTANVTWNGNLKEGHGVISSGSGTLRNTPYTFKTRFEGAAGTNPEELIAAAHASCFSMALSAELGKANITPKAIDTKATVVLEKQGQGFGVTESRLVTSVSAPGADNKAVESAAASAKENCPISKLLNAKISLDLSVRS